MVRPTRMDQDPKKKEQEEIIVKKIEIYFMRILLLEL